MKFEEVDQHVASVNLATLKATDHATATINLCAIYKAVKPILAFVETFPFFPVKWKAVIAMFTENLDLMCP